MSVVGSAGVVSASGAALSWLAAATGLASCGGWGLRVPVVCSGGAATMSDAALPWLAGELGVLSGGA